MLTWLLHAIFSTASKNVKYTIYPFSFLYLLPYLHQISVEEYKSLVNVLFLGIFGQICIIFGADLTP